VRACSHDNLFSVRISDQGQLNKLLASIFKIQTGFHNTMASHLAKVGAFLELA